MLMATELRGWSRTELDRFPDDGNRYEVLDGELFVTPQAAPDHQFIATRIVRPLADYCDLHALGEVAGPGAVVWDDNELQPDVEVIPGTRESHRVKKWEVLPFPLLVVEVLSASTRARDRGKKRAAYARLGIDTYWIVDLENRSIETWTDGSSVRTLVTGVLRWSPRAGVPPLEIDFDKIFGPS